MSHIIVYTPWVVYVSNFAKLCSILYTSLLGGGLTEVQIEVNRYSLLGDNSTNVEGRYVAAEKGSETRWK